MLGFAGSLREASFNRRLLAAASALAPPALDVETFDLSGIPLYNADVEQRGDPEPVTRFKQAIARSDALLVVTPEYQYSVPGVLKNALDWASRPPGGSPLQGKVAAIMGASPGMTGTARAQLQLRQILLYNRVIVTPGPEVLVARARDKLAEDGGLADEVATKLITELLTNLEHLTRALRAGVA